MMIYGREFELFVLVLIVGILMIAKLLLSRPSRRGPGRR